MFKNFNGFHLVDAYHQLRLQDHDTGMELCEELQKGGAHIVGDLPNAAFPAWNLDNWVCSISPNL